MSKNVKDVCVTGVFLIMAYIVTIIGCAIGVLYDMDVGMLINEIAALPLIIGNASLAIQIVCLNDEEFEEAKENGLVF